MLIAGREGFSVFILCRFLFLILIFDSYFYYQIFIIIPKKLKIQRDNWGENTAVDSENICNFCYTEFNDDLF